MKNNNSQKLFSSEEELREALLEALLRKKTKPIIEVPFLGRSVDIAYHCSDGSVTAIEVKLEPRNIRRALAQAKTCLLGAKKVYVCTPYFRIGEAIKLDLIKLGIGLIFLKHKKKKASMHYFIPAGRNDIKRAEYESLFRNALANGMG